MLPSNGHDRLYRLAAAGDPDAARELAQRARRRGDALQLATANAAAAMSETEELQAVFDRFEALREPEAELRLLALRELITLPVAAPLRLAAVELTAADDEYSVRALALELLEALLWPGQAPLDEDTVAALLERGLRDPKPAVRDRAAGALTVGDLGPLLNRRDEPPPRLRDRVTTNVDWMPHLRERFDAFETARHAVLWSNELEDEALARTTPSVTWAWMRLILDRTGSTSLGPGLPARVSLPRHFLRRLADDLELWPQAVTDLLLRHRAGAHLWPRTLRRHLEDLSLRRASYGVQCNVLQLRCELAGIEAMQGELEEAQRSTIAAVRGIAAAMLVRHPDPGVVETALHEAIQDPAPSVRQVAAWQLRAEQPHTLPDGESWLRALVHDANDTVASIALETLHESRVPLERFRADLQAIASRPHRRSSWLAERLLEELGRQKTG